MTPLGQVPFLLEFLNTANLFPLWVRECPLTYHSPYALQTVNVLGTVLPSISLWASSVCAHTTIRTDGVNPVLLGMSKVCCEDCRHSRTPVNIQWLQNYLLRCDEPWLTEPWILDVGVTVKSHTGHQEGAEVGDDPHKPGCPSHTYHPYFIGNLRLALDVAVRPTWESKPEVPQG